MAESTTVPIATQRAMAQFHASVRDFSGAEFIGNKTGHNSGWGANLDLRICGGRGPKVVIPSQQQWIL